MKQQTDEIQDIPKVMSFFGLSVAQNIVPISNGISNHNYLVKASQGEYVIKFLVTQTTENIENDIAIQNQLKQAGLETPQYVQNKNGAYIFSHNDIHAVVSKRIDGVIPRTVTEKLAYCFGQRLATFHASVLQLPHPNNNGLVNPSVSGIHSLIFTQSLPKGFIHGDFHLGNVLVDQIHQDSIVAILDFEEAGENLYIVDLAVTVMGVCSPSTDKNVIDQSLLKETLKGYETVRKLSAEEKASFPEAVKYSAEAWIKWFNNNGYAKYAEQHQKRLNSFNFSSHG